MIAGWPLREVLLAYLAKSKEQLIETFRFQQLLYQIRNAFGGEEKPPPIPESLREGRK